MTLRTPILALLAALLLFLAIACDDDDSDADATPSPTTAVTATSTAAPIGPAPTATRPPSPTLEPGACPLTELTCDFAEQLRSWLEARDVASIGAASRFESVDCPGGSPRGAGGPFPLCDGAAAGEVREGIGVARRYSEGAAISASDYEAYLLSFLDVVDPAAMDEIGGGGLALYALSCVDPAELPAACGRFTVVFSAIPAGSCCPPLGAGGLGRELLIFFVEPEGIGVITSVWTGVILPDEPAIIFEDGGTLFDLGRVFPYAGS